MAGSDRADSFLLQLKGISYQAARVAQNPHVDLNSETTRDLMREKSIDLMTAIVKMFNCALIYFNRQFFGKNHGLCLLNRVASFMEVLVDGSKMYDDGVAALDHAIKEYDQAVFDLIANVVAGSFVLCCLR